MECALVIGGVKYPIVGHDYLGRVLVEFGDNKRKYIDRADMVLLGAVLEVNDYD